MKHLLVFLFAINSLSGQTLKPFNNSYTQDYTLLIQAQITPKLSIKDLMEIPKYYEDLNAVQIYVEKLLGEAQKIEVEIDSILGSSTVHLSYPEFQLTYSNLGFDRMTLSSIYWSGDVRQFLELNPVYNSKDLISKKGAITVEDSYVYSSFDGIQTSYNPYFIFRFENDMIVTIAWHNPNT